MKRYIVCPKVREIVHHKRILYGKQEAWGKTGIIVEGTTDVWRLGTKACATFGIEYKIAQVLEIRRHFKRVFVIFDNEQQAQTKEEHLIHDLQMSGVQAYGVCIVGTDAGAMSQNDANHLVKELTHG